jgi:ribosomal protein S18 acetylase RimI-like enzyme
MYSRNLIIRDATHNDVDALVRLLEALFSIENDFVFDEIKQRRGIHILLDGCGKHRCIRVAEVNGRVIGMGSVQTMISTAEGGVVGVVEDLVVDWNWRKRKVGHKLLKSIETWSKERGLMRLQLLADKNNLPALSFYHGRNWTVTDLICLRKNP